jgi:hypothetical protein
VALLLEDYFFEELGNLAIGGATISLHVVILLEGKDYLG